MILGLIAAGGYRVTGLSDSLSTWLMVPVLLLAAFHEEIIVRGYLMRNLLESAGPFWALLLSSVVFWLFHGLNPAAWSSPLVPLNLFLAGILLGLAYLASGDLWFPTFVHYAWNAMQGVVLELPISGVETDGVVDLERTGDLPVWLTGGAFGFEASILSTASEVVLCVVFYLWWRRGRGVVQSVAG